MVVTSFCRDHFMLAGCVSRLVRRRSRVPLVKAHRTSCLDFRDHVPVRRYEVRRTAQWPPWAGPPRAGRQTAGSPLSSAATSKRLWHRATCTGSTQWSIPVVLTAAEHRCSTNLVGGAHASPRRSHTLRHHHRSSQAARDVRICTAQLAGSLSTMHILSTCRLGAVPAAAVSHGNERTATAM